MIHFVKTKKLHSESKMNISTMSFPLTPHSSLRGVTDEAVLRGLSGGPILGHLLQSSELSPLFYKAKDKILSKAN